MKDSVKKKLYGKGLCTNKNSYKSKLANIKETLKEMWISIPHHYKLPFNIDSLT